LIEEKFMKNPLIGAVIALSVGQFTSHVSAQEMGDAKKGATVAQSVCAECHAVAKGEARSPNTKAPTFTNVATTRGMTEMALRVWLQSPHPTMPNLMLGEEEKDDVIAYILSLKQK
jgi:mono/diheme cytochrome c family protein